MSDSKFKGHPAPAAWWVMAACLAAAAPLLSGCAGDGSPSGGVTTPLPPSTPSPPPPPPPPPPPLPTLPDPTSAEYQRAPSLAAMHADAPFGKGATGQGVTVAVIDTGVNVASLPDLAGALSADSTDIIAGRNAPDGVSPHGGDVSSVIASRYNGFGTIGVAYKSTILSIRADDTLGSACGTDCTFQDTDTAAGIEYAIAHGAKVINMSLGGTTPDAPEFLRALGDAVTAGVVVTVSAGNDGTADPEWPARYATDPRFAGLVVAVGASAPNGVLASFSNRAGASAAGYIVAPGQSIVTACNTNNGCAIVSGTSFSAPQVAGAVALLLQAFPNLSGRDAVSILFSTADDAGAPGVDSVYGNGLLDLAKAFQPSGTLSVQSVAGGSIGVQAPVGTTIGQAFGSRLGQGAGLLTVGRDAYQRLFAVDLADLYRPGRGAALVGAPAPSRATSATFALQGGARLTLAGEAPFGPDIDPQRTAAGFFAADPSSATLALDIGGLGLVAWKGRGEATPPEIGGPRDAFQQVAQPDRLLAASWRVGRFTVGAEEGWSRRAEPFSAQPQAASSYVRGSLAYAAPGFSARVALGQLAEPLGPLGSNLVGNSPFALPAETGFLSASAEAPLGGLLVYGSGSVGRTRFRGQILNLDGAISSSWRLGLVGACGRLGRVCRTWTLEVSQPLRLESGMASATLPAAPANYFDPVTFTERRFSLAPTGREVILGLFADQSLRRWGVARLGLVAAMDEGHISGAPLDIGFNASWRFGF